MVANGPEAFTASGWSALLDVSATFGGSTAVAGPWGEPVPRSGAFEGTAARAASLG